MIIYIRNKINLQLFELLLGVALSLDGARIVFWKYPDEEDNSKIRNFMTELLPHSLSKDKLEPVTEYDKKGKRVTGCYRFDKEVVNISLKNLKTLKEHFDNISIYRGKNKNWFFSIIFHEDMTLLRIRKSELEVLKSIGLPFTSEPPPWW